MVLQTIRRQITVEEYHRMGDAGIFHYDERLELIDGEIVKMTPIGSRHAYCENRTPEFLITHLGNRAIVSTQNPVCLGKYSEPQPDIAIIKRDEVAYITRHPNVGDVYLIIEIEIYQEPTSAGYKQMNTKKMSDTFSPSSFPDITIAVNWVLGKV